MLNARILEHTAEIVSKGVFSLPLTDNQKEKKNF